MEQLPGLAAGAGGAVHYRTAMPGEVDTEALAYARHVLLNRPTGIRGPCGPLRIINSGHRGSKSGEEREAVSCGGCRACW